MNEAQTILPVIVDPFSRLADEIAGDTPSEIALNLAAATRVTLYFRRKPIRPCVNPWTHFQGCKAELSPAAVEAIIFTATAYERFAKRQQTPGGRETGTPGHEGQVPSGRPHQLAGSSPALPMETLF